MLKPFVPRIPRGQQGGYYHIINRGNGRATVFHKPQDYEAFLSLLADAKKRHRMKLLGFCLLPNHFHLVLEPADQTALSQFMQWLLTSHVRASLSQTLWKQRTYMAGGLRASQCNAMNT
jgi:putative transposase